MCHLLASLGRARQGPSRFQLSLFLLVPLSPSLLPPLNLHHVRLLGVRSLSLWSAACTMNTVSVITNYCLCLTSCWQCWLGWFFPPAQISHQDAPSGYVLKVVCYKPGEDKGLCLKCFYIKRGSFPTCHAQELVELLRKPGALRDKWPG